MSAPVALIDANVFYDAVVRDLLMQLALSGLIRPRWTQRINDEWTRNLLANRPDINPAQLDFTTTMMVRAVPDGLVGEFESLIGLLHLPDPNDRHVLAAAIKAEADVIITLNLKDFPQSALRPYASRSAPRTSFWLCWASWPPKSWSPPRETVAPGSSIRPCRPSDTSPSSAATDWPRRRSFCANTSSTSDPRPLRALSGSFRVHLR